MEVAVPLALRLGGPLATETDGWNIYEAIVSYCVLLGGFSGLIVGISGTIVLSVIRLVIVIRRLTLRKAT